MRAGLMRQRIELQNCAETQNEHGGLVQTWATVENRWAEIKPLAAREAFTAAQVKSDATHRIRMRYYDGLTSHWRIKHGSKIYNLSSVLNPDGLQIEHELMAKEEV